jgi:hypothetical protein
MHSAATARIVGLPYASTGCQSKAKQDMPCAVRQGRLDGMLGRLAGFFLFFFFLDLADGCIVSSET